MFFRFDKKSLNLSFAIFSSFWAVMFFDSLDRSESSGGLFLLMLVYFALCGAFLLIRFLWGIFCGRLDVGRSEKKSFRWARLVLDVIPYTVFVLAFMWQDLNSFEFLILPALLAVLEYFYADEEVSQGKKSRFFLLVALCGGYFLCGTWLFRGMNFSGNMVYLLAHFLEYLFPVFLFSGLRTKFFVDKIQIGERFLIAIFFVLFLKILFGRISQLDVLFWGWSLCIFLFVKKADFLLGKSARRK